MTSCKEETLSTMTARPGLTDSLTQWLTDCTFARPARPVQSGRPGREFEGKLISVQMSSIRIWMRPPGSVALISRINEGKTRTRLSSDVFSERMKCTSAKKRKTKTKPRGAGEPSASQGNVSLVPSRTESNLRKARVFEFLLKLPAVQRRSQWQRRFSAVKTKSHKYFRRGKKNSNNRGTFTCFWPTSPFSSSSPPPPPHRFFS